MKPRTAFEMIIVPMRRCSKSPVLLSIFTIVAAMATNVSDALAQTHEASGGHGGGEASLRLPDLSTVKFQGVDGHTLLLFGPVICVLGLLFGLAIYKHLKNLPVHRA